MTGHKFRLCGWDLAHRPEVADPCPSETISDIEAFIAKPLIYGSLPSASSTSSHSTSDNALCIPAAYPLPRDLYPTPLPLHLPHIPLFLPFHPFPLLFLLPFSFIYQKFSS